MLASRPLRLLALPIAAAGLARAADAQPAASFYADKTVQIVIGFQAGSGYDTYGRTLARHLGKHLPGTPSVVAQNMTGAGSLLAANHLYNLAPKDGTTIGIFGRSTSLEPLLGTPEAKFEAAKFFWIGSMGPEVTLCVAWAKSPFKTWADLKQHEFVAAATALSNDTGALPVLFNKLLGTRMKIITGYRGGPEMSQAIEAGEAHGRCGWSWTSVKSTKPDWIANKSINILTQVGLKKTRELPDVPLALDLATTERQRQVMTLVFAPQEVAWPFVAPPGLPEARKVELRKAFDAAMRDPDLLAEGKKLGLDIDPMPGAQVEQVMVGLYKTSPDIVAEVKEILRPKKK